VDFVLQILQSFFGEIGDVRHGLGFIPVRALDRKWRLTGQSKKKKTRTKSSFLLLQRYKNQP
jgi:hypothetical protein